jgi:hypothetical protein
MDRSFGETTCTYYTEFKANICDYYLGNDMPNYYLT